jgi:hypothetical protein
MNYYLVRVVTIWDEARTFGYHGVGPVSAIRQALNDPYVKRVVWIADYWR